MKLSRSVVKLGLIAHVLAWVAFLPIVIGFVLWPAFQGEVGVEFKVLATVFMPVALTGLGLLTILTTLQRAESNRDSAALVVLLTAFCILGIFSVSQLHLPLQVKLLLGIAIGSFPLISIIDVGKVGSAFFLAVSSLLTLGFCTLAMFSVGIFFLPAALTLLASAIILALQSRSGTRQMSGGRVSTFH